MDKNKAFLKKDDFNKNKRGKEEKSVYSIINSPNLHSFLLLKTYLHALNTSVQTHTNQVNF